jgi:hypothetical protein
MDEILLTFLIAGAALIFCVGWFGHLVIDAYCDIEEQIEHEALS